MAEVEDLDTTDANNTGRFPEAMALSAVNNGARALEGLLARHFSDTNAGMLATATSTTDYTIASNKTVSSYSDGLTVRAQAHSTSTGSVTLNVDSVGAQNVVWNDGSQTQLGSGDLIEDQVVTFVYDLGNTVWVVESSVFDQSTFITASSTTTLTNKTYDAGGTGNSLSLTTDSVDAITEIASALKTGSDTKLVTGTAGTNGNVAAWNGDGDIVDGGSPGKVAQVVSTQTGAVNTGTTVMPADDTIPQNDEGDEYMTLAVTPTNASSTLIIDVVFNFATSTAQVATIALFQDSTASALAAISAQDDAGGTNQERTHCFRHIMTAGTTSETTFKIRAGLETSGTLSFNGVSGSRTLGGVMASSIVIAEYLP